MIYKCRFCEFSKEEKLSHNILKVLSDKELPHEDYMLWLRRLIDNNKNFKNYNGVKIHMGMKHKKDTYKYISPEIQFDKAESKIINLEGKYETAD